MRRITWLALGILSFVVPASAQQAPRADISLGYSYLREGFSGGSNAQGGNLSGAGYFNDWFGIAGDFGAYHVSESGISANTYTYLVGPRFSANRKGRTSVFVQARRRRDGRGCVDKPAVVEANMIPIPDTAAAAAADS